MTHEHARKLIHQILIHVGHDDAEAWKVGAQLSACLVGPVFAQPPPVYLRVALKNPD